MDQSRKRGCLLPSAAYAALAGSALAAYSSMHDAMFGAGTAALLLLLIGIHNACDAVTYHIFSNGQGEDKA